MSGTQDSIGITPDKNAQYAKDGGANDTNYNRDLAGQRKSNKSLGGPWSADTVVNPQSVKSSTSDFKDAD